MHGFSSPENRSNRVWKGPTRRRGDQSALNRSFAELEKERLQVRADVFDRELLRRLEFEGIALQCHSGARST
jgi:hypothetical protein